MVWLTYAEESGRLFFEATSDAPMVRGLIAILLAAYSGKTPEAIVELDIQKYFERIQLKSFITTDAKQRIAFNGSPRSFDRARHAGCNRFKGFVARCLEATTSRSLAAHRRNAQRFSRLHQRRLYPIRRYLSRQRRFVAASTPSYRRDDFGLLQALYANVHRSDMNWLAKQPRKWSKLDNRSLATSTRRAPSRLFSLLEPPPGSTWWLALGAMKNLVAGDEILLSEMEHHSNIVPWQQLAARTGAVIRWLPITDDFKLDLDAFSELLTSRVKLVSITAVSNVLGTINPIEQIVSTAKAKGAVVLVDAAQAVPHGGVDVQAWKADFVAFSGHKMLGPTASVSFTVVANCWKPCHRSSEAET